MRASATGILVAATASVLCGTGAGAAQATEPTPAAPAAPPVAVEGDQDDEDSDEAGNISGGNRGLLVIDNSYADSWLEIDRTLNTLINSRGTAGSDHDGGGGAIDVQAGDVSQPGADTQPGTGTGTGTGTSTGSNSGTGAQPCSCQNSSPLGWLPQIGHPPWQGENGE